MGMYVWYSKSTSVTGKALRIALNCEGGIYAPKRRHNPVVIWGAVPKTVSSRVLRNKKVLHDPFLIRAYTDKYLALTELQSKGVQVPPFSLYPSTLSFPMIRRSNHHSGGRGFELFTEPCNLGTVPNKHYLSFVPSDAEYRVHVFLGEVIKVSRKKPLHDNAIDTCRSHANGWYFSKCDIERVPDQIKEQAVLAVQALSYDFGAVDILYTRGGKATVLEVNSGMGLDNSGIALYVSKILDWQNM